MAVEFTAQEISALQKDPDALRALAQWHSVQETLATAIDDTGEVVKYHGERHEELQAAAHQMEVDVRGGLHKRGVVVTTQLVRDIAEREGI